MSRTYEWQTQLGPVIAEYWEGKFPDEAGALKRAHCFEKSADRAAEDALGLLVEATTKYRLSYTEAEKLAFTKWETPPAAPPRAEPEVIRRGRKAG